jgi:secondary thiamine-phosphate synthase enzyme
MLTQVIQELTVGTGERGFYEITETVQSKVRETRFRNGLATLQLLHTSASLLIQENADPEVRRDFERFFAQLVPDGSALFRHTAEGADDMAAHIRTALTTVNLSIPIVRGCLALGTWQGIYLWEHRAVPHRRKMVLHLLGE